MALRLGSLVPSCISIHVANLARFSSQERWYTESLVDLASRDKFGQDDVNARGTPGERRPGTGSTKGGFLRKASVVVILTLALLSLGREAFAASGDLDPTSDGDGKVTASFGDETFVNALALQSDGKMVVEDKPATTPGSRSKRLRTAALSWRVTRPMALLTTASAKTAR